MLQESEELQSVENHLDVWVASIGLVHRLFAVNRDEPNWEWHPHPFVRNFLAIHEFACDAQQVEIFSQDEVFEALGRVNQSFDIAWQDAELEEFSARGIEDLEGECEQLVEHQNDLKRILTPRPKPRREA